MPNDQNAGTAEEAETIRKEAEKRAAEGTAAATAPALQKIIGAVDPKLLKTYKIMLGYQFGGALMLVVFLVAAMLIAYKFKDSYQPPLLLLVLLAGMLGAFFSALTRLYKIEQLADAVISPTVSELGAFYLLIFSLVAPLVGAIAAVVIYISFAGEFLQGGLFPTIRCKGECGSFVDVVANYIPNEPKDYAKALVWGFIAGFSERLVPDTLQTFATQRGQTTDAKPGGAT